VDALLVFCMLLMFSFGCALYWLLARQAKVEQALFFLPLLISSLFSIFSSP
jgi:hypothetical protein